MPKDKLGRNRRGVKRNGEWIAKPLRPSDWIWPFKTFVSFKMYREYFKICSLDELEKMREEIAKYGFSYGIGSFESWLISKRAWDRHNAKMALEDIAKGKEPGQSYREYREDKEAREKLYEERARKQELIREYQTELKAQELDKVSAEDIIEALRKMRENKREP